MFHEYERGSWSLEGSAFIVVVCPVLINHHLLIFFLLCLPSCWSGSEGNAYLDIREGDMAVKHAGNSTSRGATGWLQRQREVWVRCAKSGIPAVWSKMLNWFKLNWVHYCGTAVLPRTLTFLPTWSQSSPAAAALRISAEVRDFPDWNIASQSICAGSDPSATFAYSLCALALLWVRPKQ